MRLWRIARSAYPALDGEGARIAGGRWNSKGIPIVYTAGSRALAALEVLAWTDPEDVPSDYEMVEIDVPEGASLEVVDPGQLPPDWRKPRNQACRAVGDAWASAGRSAVLQVPSALIPEEPNFLINPRHSEAAGIRRVVSRPFSFDPRLL
ncbi:MAG TPA: RES domain-containing protein [Longimicrobiaceae bacterium]|nr:RES domain-containing protein [Longimicrobiaceae bacterium]